MTRAGGLSGALRALLVVCSLVGAAACRKTPDSETLASALRASPGLRVPGHTEELGRCTHYTPERQVLFGDLHVHTSFSLDANLQGARVGPIDAYRFARGQRIGIPPYDDEGNPTRFSQLRRPLDFAALTDHAEYLGVVGACNDDRSPAYRRMGCRWFRTRPEDAFVALNSGLSRQGRSLGYPRLCGPNARDCIRHQLAAWIDLQNAAEGAQDRTTDCRFTSLIGYEWTATPAVGISAAANLHRNVIFRNSVVPRVPIEYMRAPDVEQLWQGLERECIDAPGGCDALAIPHNSNLSYGQMFLPWDRGETHRSRDPFTVAHAARRARMEPLIEIYQHKGSSECLPGGLTGDEDCGFELVPYRDIGAAARDRRVAPHPADYIRTALAWGMGAEQLIGQNPFQMGFIASTDTHTGLAGAVDEDSFLGAGGAGGTGGRDFPDRVYFGGGGLAAVWAEENSREGVFRALRRRETYGTSGTRIAVRVFGGWEMPSDWCVRPDRAAAGYAHGVPMGSVLRARVDDTRAPQLAIAALRDPEGAGLAEVQIVKGWLDRSGGSHVRVFTLRDSDAHDDQLNLNTCEYAGGNDSSCGVWTDPEFDPTLPAYYYVRVLEIPTCRWTTLMCVGAGYDCDRGTRAVDRACCAPEVGLHPHGCATTECTSENRDDRCCQPDVVRPTIRERAWTSPIWYVPHR